MTLLSMTTWILGTILFILVVVGIQLLINAIFIIGTIVIDFIYDKWNEKK